MTLPALDVVAVPGKATPLVIPARGYWRRVGRQLSREPVTMVCAVVLALIFLAAIFADYLAAVDPDKTRVFLSLKPFGFRVPLLASCELGRDLLSRLLYG